MNVIIGSINSHKSYRDFYTGAHKFKDNEQEEICSKLEDRIENGIKVYSVISFEEIVILLNENPGKTIIFSNFPPNESYERHKVLTKKDHEYIKATGYSKTIENYKAILSKYQHIELHIITGASKEALTDEIITSISASHRITVVRKKEWLNSIDYYESYLDHMGKIIQNA